MKKTITSNPISANFFQIYLKNQKYNPSLSLIARRISKLEFAIKLGIEESINATPDKIERILLHVQRMQLELSEVLAKYLFSTVS